MLAPYGYANTMLSDCQSAPEEERPCMPIAAVPEEPAVTVICATTALPAVASGPLSGDIQNTAPSLVARPLLAVHAAKSMPIEESAPAASPPVMPTVSHESY